MTAAQYSGYLRKSHALLISTKTAMRCLPVKESKKMRRYNGFLRKESGLPGRLTVLAAAKSYQR